ncbi:MAG: hypothetical protein OXB96_01315, partial [Candidatus Kaiserbacteria bacterium]|nr:hypothetical protein [Candidatus Kaiserbacteria bacterium]
MRIIISFYFLAFILFLFSIPFCFATGPGNVTGSLAGWYKAGVGVSTDDGTTPASDGGLLSTWTDASSVGATATQSTSGNKPTVRTDGGWNDYPFVAFDGTDDFLDISIDPLKNSDYTVFFVGTRKDSMTGNLVLGGVTEGVNQNLILGYPANTQALLGQGSNDLTATIAAFDTPSETPFLLYGQLDTSSGHALSEFRNGTETAVSNTNTTPISGSLAAAVGRHSTDFFNGDLYEMIFYSDALTDANVAKILSYLALKYGVTLGSRDYVNSTGTVIFDTDGSYSGYTHHVAGIGRDDLSGFSHMTSTSSGEAVLTVSADTLLANNTFLVWGDDGGDTALTRDDVPIGITSRTGRMWRFHRTGDIGKVTLAFDLTLERVINTKRGSDFALLVSDSPAMHNAEILTITPSLSRDGILSFSDVSLDSGQYISFGAKKDRAASLGGVLRNVRLWLDAEDPEVLHTDTSCTSAPANNGDAVRCWEDKSIYASHV